MFFSPHGIYCSWDTIIKCSYLFHYHYLRALGVNGDLLSPFRKPWHLTLWSASLTSCICPFTRELSHLTNVLLWRPPVKMHWLGAPADFSNLCFKGIRKLLSVIFWISNSLFLFFGSLRRTRSTYAYLRVQLHFFWCVGVCVCVCMYVF